MRKLLYILLMLPSLMLAQETVLTHEMGDEAARGKINRNFDTAYIDVANLVLEVDTSNTNIDSLLNVIDPSDSTAVLNKMTVDTIELSYLIHAFMYFGDSAVSLSYTTAWAHLTNATDSLFIQQELDGFTVSGDTMTFVNVGDYDISGNFAHDGNNTHTVSIRFYNVTQAAGIPVAGAQTMRGANNFGSTFVLGYAEITAGDKVVVQYKGDASGTAVFKNASLRITRIHN